MKLKDKVALVVGASQGSGRAYVLALAREGAKVIAAARTLSKPSEPDSILTLEGIAREAAREGFSVDTIACDVERDAEVHDMVERAIADHGRIDVLVFAVGIYPRHDAFTITAQQWDRVMDVNVRGAYYLVRSVAPHMIAQGSGSIVLLTSACADTTGGASGHQDLLMYCISKAAVNRLTTWCADEFRPHGIAVNAFSPGTTLTETMRRLYPDKYEEHLKAGSGNVPTPEVLGPPIVYLAQQSAQTLTGQIFHTNTFGSGWGPRDEDMKVLAADPIVIPHDPNAPAR
ncbi:SDR family NAD(P)-dependent oxidoreductase [Mycobacterium sp. IDR2000157661]|uniref:SDR family NAD(P)-dependent oxidoreductase n=1 Tax=Mycobacterium sp. IDR2000157661 TaxID=2867005 RepID=UPI001EEB1B6A|nr:SDR family oxidoreductase [Mycobacterium sp. IDR2000157661]ULE31336.1 SDR family oxidoreductase [Mycobacterium sp. IDR2000157661]